MNNGLHAKKEEGLVYVMNGDSVLAEYQMGDLSLGNGVTPEQAALALYRGRPSMVPETQSGLRSHGRMSI